uniref:RxLR effector candidate protein n=1 Tax=Hyaloperonospora arabidopsidis (strain Emoy2) TaxID=559515 RepID=M4BJP8_HYAAE
MVRVLVHAVLMLSILPLVISYKDEKLEESNVTHLNAGDYWKHDHSYTYRPHWKRLPEDEMFVQRLKMMNASEMIQELNLSLPVEPIEGMGRDDMYRQNTTQAYKHDGANDICALDQIHMQLQEYHFDTGIPRLAIRPNVSHSIFPSLQGFLRTSLEIANASTQSRCSSSYDSSKATTVQSRSSEQHTNEDGNNTGNVTNIYSRSEVYAALTHFYTYPSADNKIIESYVDEDTHECTMERLCLVYSGVTVYTPALTSPGLLQTFANPGVIPTTTKVVRLNMLLEMILVAFEAEKRALQHGLQGPSTVWYSSHDLDVDEFADAVLGTFNMSISANGGDAESISLHVFEYHMNERVPILDEVVSYYADTNYDTQMYMKVKRTIVMPESLDESELVVLVSSLEKQMKTLDQSIVSYVQTRAANPLYQEVVNAAIRSDVYNGSEYTMVGFGFILPATNDRNVLYYDMKLPVPFHLFLRLIVRFQESRLLLPRESRHLLVCLAMAHFDLSFYRCRAPASSDD